MQEFTEIELKNEVWKDIPGYEGLYQVSDLGRVKSLSREVVRNNTGNFICKEIILKQGVNYGYYHVSLCKNGKCQTRQIHQLVAMAFLNHVPCGNLIEVNHKDEVRTNNRLTNLEILTHEEHVKFTHRNATSKYKGVHFDKEKNKWIAQIIIKGKTKGLGYFFTELEAHESRKKAEEMVRNGDFSFMKIREESSKYKGVSFNKASNKWTAYITIKGQTKYLGLFNTELEAYEAVQKALKEKNIQKV